MLSEDRFLDDPREISSTFEVLVRDAVRGELVCVRAFPFNGNSTGIFASCKGIALANPHDPAALQQISQRAQILKREMIDGNGSHMPGSS